MQKITCRLARLPFLCKMTEKMFEKLLWYTLIGIITFIITNTILYVLRRIVGMTNVLSVMVSYAMVFVLHFLLHNSLTFKKSPVRLQRRLGGHLIVSIANYFIGVAITSVMIKFVIDSNIIATALSTIVTFVFGFTVLDKYVYKLNKKEKVEK